MSHIHWTTRQNKLEIPRDKDEVNKGEIHECEEDVTLRMWALVIDTVTTLEILLLLSINKTKVKDNICMWVSVF
jgi:hypothetical protein